MVQRLFGRQREQRSVRDWLGPGSGRRTVELVGEAGVGKSSLIDWYAGAVDARGGLVLRSTCSEAERGLAWSTLSMLLEPVQARVPVAIAATANAPVGTATTHQGVAAALRALLTELAAERELLVVIDDSMWVDAASCVVLSSAMRTVTPCRWICARRTDTPATFDLPRLLGNDASTMTLDGLRLADVGRLMADLLGEVRPHQEVEAMHRLTLGNPLHVRELTLSMRDGADRPDAVLPASVEAAFAARVAELDDASRSAALVAALATPPSVALLERVFPGSDVIATLSALETARVLRVRGNTIAFAHPLVRHAVLGLAPGSEVLRVHRLLAASAVDVVERAQHLAAATFEPDAAAAAILDDAAAELMRRGAPSEAAALSQKAATLTVDPAARRKRDLDAAKAWTAVARWDLARPLYDGLWSWVEQHRDDAGSLELGLEVARGMLVEPSGTAEVVAATLRRADVLAGSPHAVAVLLSLIARGQQLLNVPAGLALARRAMELAVQSGEREVLWMARVALANALAVAGEPVDRRLLDDPPELRLDQPWSSFQTACETLVFLEEHEQARRYLDELVEACRRYHRPGPMLAMSALTMDLEFRAGNWDRVLEIDRSLDDLSSPQIDDVDRDSNAVRVLAARGDVELLGTTRPADLLKREGPPLEELTVMSTWGFVALCSGDWTSAAALLRRAHAGALGLGVGDDRCNPYHADLVEALLRVDAVAEAGAVADELDTIARRSGEPEAAADAARCRAMVTAATGQLEAADTAFDEALARCEAHRRPFDRARTLLVAGEFQRRRRRRAAARATLAHAREIFERLGAAAWTDRADRELALLGRAGATQELTSAELRVARLVGAGRRNKEIAAELSLSLRTVEWTVSAIYRKLGVSTRVAVGQELQRSIDARSTPDH